MKDRAYYHSIPLFLALGWFGAKYDFVVEALAVSALSLAIYIYVYNTDKD